MSHKITIIIHAGFACPRCKTEAWATNSITSGLENGYCRSCAYSGGEPLKIIED